MSKSICGSGDGDDLGLRLEAPQLELVVQVVLVRREVVRLSHVVGIHVAVKRQLSRRAGHSIQTKSYSGNTQC